MRASLAVGLSLACACATAPVRAPEPSVAAPKIELPASTAVAPPPAQAPARPHPSRSLAPVLEFARASVGHQRIRLRGKLVRPDCSGFVRAAFGRIGLDLFAVRDPPPRATGVRLIHAWLEAAGGLEEGAAAQPGDIVFFDNTWDRDRDGRLDDRLTHVGLVDEVEPDGTVFVIHATSRGVVREAMNLAHPHEHLDAEGREWNGFLRRRSSRDRPDTPHLMAELFAGFGSVANVPLVADDDAPHALDAKLEPLPDDDDLPPPPIPPP